MAFGFQRPPIWRDFAEIMKWIFDVPMQGKLNCVDEITLTINVATTTITDKRIGADTTITLTAKTANAAAEMGGTALYVDTFGDGSAVIHHVNSATASRTFRVAYLG